MMCIGNYLLICRWQLTYAVRQYITEYPCPLLHNHLVFFYSDVESACRTLCRNTGITSASNHGLRVRQRAVSGDG